MDKMHRMKSGGYSRFIYKLSVEIQQNNKYYEITNKNRKMSYQGESEEPVTINTMQTAGIRNSGPSESLSANNHTLKKSVNSQFNLSKLRKKQEPEDLWLKRSSFEKFSDKFNRLKKLALGSKKHFSGKTHSFLQFMELKMITGLSFIQGDNLFKKNRDILIDQFSYCEMSMKEFSSIFQNFYQGFKLERQDLEIVYVDFGIPFDKGDIELDMDEDW